jgi:hypothetical protein
MLDFSAYLAAQYLTRETVERCSIFAKRRLAAARVR